MPLEAYQNPVVLWIETDVKNGVARLGLGVCERSNDYASASCLKTFDDLSE